MHKICDPKILQSPEMVFLARAGLVHYLHPEWIPNITQIARKVESIVNANGPDELAGLDVGHYRYLRETDENSMTAIMGKLQAFKRPITQSDYDGLLEWFKILAGFFLFVRPTNGTIALRSLPADEQNRFGEVLRCGLFMAHCMNLVKRTINDGRKVDSNDLYDMLQLILLDDDNALFVTREKNVFLYEIDQNKPKRVLRWTDFISSA
jgi:hypothetical protein